MKSILGVLAVVLLFIGCGEQDANDSNFTKAINDYYNKDCLSYGIDVNRKIDLISKNQPKYAQKNSKEKLAEYDYFVKLGFLTVKEETEDRKLMFSNKTVKQKVNVYTLTDEGKKYYKAKRGRGFCYANYKVDKILNFTKPSEAFGQTISRVKFTRTLTNIADYAKTDEFKKLFERPTIVLGSFKLFDYKKEARRDLILTEKGWVDHTELR